MAENRFDESDVPYQADFTGDREATRKSQQQTRSNGRKHHDTGPPLDPVPAPDAGRSYGPDLSDEAKAKLAEFEKKLLGGTPLDDGELEILTQLGALNLMGAKRPSVRAAAIKLLSTQREKKLAGKAPEAATDAQGGAAPASGLNTP